MKELDVTHIFSRGEYLVLVIQNNEIASWDCIAYKQTPINKLPKDLQKELPEIMTTVMLDDVNKEERR